MTRDDPAWVDDLTITADVAADRCRTAAQHGDPDFMVGKATGWEECAAELRGAVATDGSMVGTAEWAAATADDFGARAVRCRYAAALGDRADALIGRAMALEELAAMLQGPDALDALFESRSRPGRR